MSSILKVVGYARCSIREQATEGLSLEAQRARVEAWCKATGSLLGDFVVDSGVSGGMALKERPGGSQIAALLDSRRPGVDAVVVTRLDRLGRDAGEALNHLKVFSEGPLGLVSLNDR